VRPGCAWKAEGLGETRSTKHEIRKKSGAPDPGGRNVSVIRISSFEFLSDFGFRISRFRPGTAPGIRDGGKNRKGCETRGLTT